MDSILNELNDAGDGTSEDVVSFHHLNQAIIHSGLASGMDGEPIDLEIGLSQWGKIEEPHQGFFGIVAGEEVANWWLKKGKRLFAKNIRQMSYIICQSQLIYKLHIRLEKSKMIKSS